MTDDIFSRITQEVSTQNKKILHDWGGAYLAHHYLENGKLPDPGSFTLVQMPFMKKLEDGFAWGGYNYTFEPRDDDKWIKYTDEKPILGQFVIGTDGRHVGECIAASNDLIPLNHRVVTPWKEVTHWKLFPKAPHD